MACATVVAPKAAWIRRGACGIHGAVLADPDFYVNHGNHALNQSRGLLAAGCILGRRDWQRLAARRIAVLIVESVDSQGVTNSQSVYYQFYNLQAYRAAGERLRACGMDVPRTFRRLDRMPDLLTHATLPDGTYMTLGDTVPRQGQSNSRNDRRVRRKQRAGRVRCPRSDPPCSMPASRSGAPAGGPARPIRAGGRLLGTLRPGRRNHGHLDHGAVTLYGYGSRLVDDPGQFSANVNAVAQVRDQQSGAQRDHRGRRRVRRIRDRERSPAVRTDAHT